ncbi:tyrosine-type recombinase/integrase [Brevundimonas sp. NPDC090276]|uniref:tyrosine-type recombinase/integrase n=1 Tax=Brevundimonas sp. NPDC090276 TaxID=3363956 RepID=UPI00383BC270
MEVGVAGELTTDRQISALKPAAKAYERKVSGSRGLALRVFPSGSRQFEYRYVTAGGVRRRLVLGAYPGLTLAKARIAANASRMTVLEGADPVGERAQTRDRLRTGETLNDLAEAYWAAAAVGLHGGRRRPKRAISIQRERNTWKLHVREPLGGRPFVDIRRAEIKAFMVQEERIEINPVTGLSRPLALTSRERMFDDAGLKTIRNVAIEASLPRVPGEGGGQARLEPVMGLAIQLLMLTLTRRTEIAGARKAEVDRAAGLWIIPSERSKARHPHVVPLGARCLEVIEMAWGLDPDSPFLFPSPRSPDQHLDPHAITRAIARTCERKGLPLGSPHDVRRSGATTLTGRYGFSRLIVGLVLGHTPKEGAAVTGVYDRHTYVPEKCKALEVWANHLCGEASPKGSGAEVYAGEGTEGPESSQVLAAYVEAAKARAMALCAAGNLHGAVLGLCMELSRRSETAGSHLDILARGGMELAISGSKGGVEAWVTGFR